MWRRGCGRSIGRRGRGRGSSRPPNPRTRAGRSLVGELVPAAHGLAADLHVFGEAELAAESVEFLRDLVADVVVAPTGLAALIDVVGEALAQEQFDEPPNLLAAHTPPLVALMIADSVPVCHWL